MNAKQIQKAEKYIRLNAATYMGLRNENAVPLTQHRKDALAHHLAKINQLLRELIEDAEDFLSDNVE